MSDDARRAILARRASFIAAAMASLAAESCTKPEARPDPVEPPPAIDAATTPLITPPVMEPADLTPPPSATPTGSAKPHRPKPVPHPHVCLKVAPRREGDP